MEAKRTKNGDRALLVYLFDAQDVDEYALETAIESALAANEVGEVEKGATVRVELETAKTVESILTAENWRRSVRVGAVEGTLFASLYFAKQPQTDGDGDEEEPEPLNLSGVVCDALAERFPGLRVGSSAFVVRQDQRVFDLSHEESVIV